MPIKPENLTLYPPDWKAISHAAKERAGWKCQHPGCTADQYAVGRWMLDAKGGALFLPLWTPVPPYRSFPEARIMAADIQGDYGDDSDTKIIVIVLTVGHLNHEPQDCRPENLAAWCQRHHLAYDQQHHLQTAYMTRRARALTLELPL